MAGRVQAQSLAEIQAQSLAEIPVHERDGAHHRRFVDLAGIQVRHGHGLRRCIFAAMTLTARSSRP
jgi:hypothetical protein